MRKKTNMRINSGTHHMLKVYAARKGLNLSAAIQDLVSAAELSDAIKGDWKPPPMEAKKPKRQKRQRGEGSVLILENGIASPDLSKGVYGGKRK